MDPSQPIVRATMESGETWDDPSEDLFFELLLDIQRGDEKFLVVDHLERAPGDHFIQTVLDADGNWVVEHRAGGPDTHQQATVGGTRDDMRLVHEVIVHWAYGLSASDAPVPDGDWRTLLAWMPVEL